LELLGGSRSPHGACAERRAGSARPGPAPGTRGCRRRVMSGVDSNAISETTLQPLWRKPEPDESLRRIRLPPGSSSGLARTGCLDRHAAATGQRVERPSEVIAELVEVRHQRRNLPSARSRAQCSIMDRDGECLPLRKRTTVYRPASGRTSRDSGTWGRARSSRRVEQRWRAAARRLAHDRRGWRRRRLSQPLARRPPGRSSELPIPREKLRTPPPVRVMPTAGGVTSPRRGAQRAALFVDEHGDSAPSPSARGLGVVALRRRSRRARAHGLQDGFVSVSAQAVLDVP